MDGPRQSRAVTLVEVVVAVSLVGLVGLGLTLVYATSQRQMAQSINFTSSQNEASFALEHIQRHLFVARAITEPAEGAVSNRLNFTWERPTGAVTSVYQLSSSDLTVQDNGGPSQTIARNISEISFDRRSDRSKVNITVTAVQASGADTRQIRLSTSVAPRGLL